MSNSKTNLRPLDIKNGESYLVCSFGPDLGYQIIEGLDCLLAPTPTHLCRRGDDTFQLLACIWELPLYWALCTETCQECPAGVDHGQPAACGGRKYFPAKLVRWRGANEGPVAAVSPNPVLGSCFGQNRTSFHLRDGGGWVFVWFPGKVYLTPRQCQVPKIVSFHYY